MPNSTHQNDVQIDRVHSGAVCKEIGEKLSVVLGPQSIRLPPHLVTLMERLSKDEQPQQRSKGGGV